MARTIVDIDDELLAAAMQVLKTATKKDTVNAALAEVVARRARDEFLEFMSTDPLPDLRDPDVMARAWG